MVNGVMIRNKAMGHKDAPGLTVLESVLTLAVIATLLTVAFPLIAQYSSGYRLRGAAREVAADLQFARLLAVKESRDFQVVFNSNSYRVVRASDGFVTKSRSFSIDYPEINLSTVAVTFNSRGNSDSGAVTISHPMGTKNITVGSTGRVKLQ